MRRIPIRDYEGRERLFRGGLQATTSPEQARVPTQTDALFLEPYYPQSVTNNKPDGNLITADQQTAADLVLL